MRENNGLLNLVHDVVDESAICNSVPRGARQIVTLAPWQLWLARKNHDYAQAVRAADAVTIDGRWLQKCLNLAGLRYPLLTGRRIVEWHLNTPNATRVTVVGSSPRSLELVCLLRPDWLCIGGAFEEAIDPGRLQEVVEQVIQHKTTLVFVALGSPKQEKWGRLIADLAEVTVVGVGGAVETAAGIRRTPSPWMQKFHLEWLQRVAQDPRRFVPRICQAFTVLPMLILEGIRLRLLNGIRHYPDL